MRIARKLQKLKRCCCSQNISLIMSIAIACFCFLVYTQRSKQSLRKQLNSTKYKGFLPNLISVDDDQRRSNESTSESNRSFEFAQWNQLSLNRRGFITALKEYSNLGLGNEMFIYASLIGLARDYLLHPVLLQQGSYLLQHTFDIRAPLVDNSIFYWHNRIRMKECCLHSTKLIPFPVPSLTTSLLNANHEPASEENYQITAYLQSWKYFQRIFAYLRTKEFRFKPEITLRAKQRRADIWHSYCNLRTDSARYSRCLLVGVHIRRGDFLQHAKEGFTVAGADYVKRAVGFYVDKFSGYHLVFAVLGDDYDWNVQCLSYVFAHYRKGVSVVFIPPTDASLDMKFLSRCDHVLISSGTFGWWAAFLSQGMVVYMKDFPKNGSSLGRQTVREDYYLPSWIGL